MQYEVFHRHVFGKVVRAGIDHLALNRERALLLSGGAVGHEEFVLVLQRHVGLRVVHDGAGVDAKHFQRAVGLAAAQYGVLRISIFSQSAGRGEQLAHGGDVAAILVLAGAHHGTFRLHHIRVAVECGVHRHGVAVAHVEVGSAVLVERVYRKASALLAYYVHHVLIGITGKAARIFEQGGKTLVRLHFVHHRAFHLACDVDKTVVSVYRDYVVGGERHVAFQVAVEDIVIYVYR